MTSEQLNWLPLWGLGLAGCAIAWLAVECGYRFGRWRHRHAAQEKEGPIGAMVGSILALLAFMLAFTFGLAGTRYDARRHVVLDEANAIGTTYLRARFLPAPHRIEVERLLREYVELRLTDVRGRESGDRVADIVSRSDQLLESLWSQATAVVAKDATPVTALFVSSLNDVIDLHAKRVMLALRSRIPFEIWIGLLLLAALGLSSMGYQAGVSAMKRSPAMLGLVIAFASVLYLIADLDRPAEGSLSTNQGAMIDLLKSMRTGQPQ